MNAEAIDKALTRVHHAQKLLETLLCNFREKSPLYEQLRKLESELSAAWVESVHRELKAS